MFVCIPVLRIVHLMIIFLRLRKKERVVIYYNTLPRYLRGFIKIFRISEKRIVSVFRFFTSLPIKKIKHGDDVPDYPYLHLSTMELVTTIARQLIDGVKKNSWMKFLKKLIGEEPAIAYTIKHLSQYQLFIHILPIVVCYRFLSCPENYVVVWDPGWVDEWAQIIRYNLKEIKFEFFKWPNWYLLIRRFSVRFNIVLKVFFITIVYILRRGITFKSISKQHFKIVTEFNDPRRLNSTAYDADYWIDNSQVTQKDILFFLTENQKKILFRDGYTINDIEKLFRQKGYHIIIIDNLCYPLSVLKSLLLSYLGLIKSIFDLDASVLDESFFNAWIEYLNFILLFEYYTADNLIYLTFPNGHTSFRLNDAIITGLCRKYKITSVGCQTRTIYTKKFEDCFDCFDIYLSWGKAWEEVAEERTLFVNRVVTVGCIYLDYLLPLYKRHQSKLEKKEKKKLVISIFPSDISYNHHYTKGYAKSLLINCAKLAIKYPKFLFRIKTKDPEHIQIILNDKNFSNIYSLVKDNFIFIGNLRYSYEEVLFLSDIIIAIGFTTPGTEGLLLGKRSIYYSELKCGGQAFNHIKDIVATSFEELQALFEKAILDYRNYAIINSKEIEKLDPFRDGMTLKRIHQVLLGDRHG